MELPCQNSTVNQIECIKWHQNQHKEHIVTTTNLQFFLSILNGIAHRCKLLRHDTICTLHHKHKFSTNTLQTSLFWHREAYAPSGQNTLVVVSLIQECSYMMQEVQHSQKSAQLRFVRDADGERKRKTRTPVFRGKTWIFWNECSSLWWSVRHAYVRAGLFRILWWCPIAYELFISPCYPWEIAEADWKNDVSQCMNCSKIGAPAISCEFDRIFWDQDVLLTKSDHQVQKQRRKTHSYNRYNPKLTRTTVTSTVMVNIRAICTAARADGIQQHKEYKSTSTPS